MPELNPEEVQRLAREFLALRAGESEAVALTETVENNAGAALELLAQMRPASGDSAPGDLDAALEASVSRRVEALIRAGARRPWYLFFKRRPKAEPEAEEAAAPNLGIPSKAPVSRGPNPAPREAFKAVAPSEDDMEDTAPISVALPKSPSALTPLVPPYKPAPPAPRPPAVAAGETSRPLGRVMLWLALPVVLLVLGALKWGSRFFPSPWFQPAVVGTSPVPSPPPVAGPPSRGQVLPPAPAIPLPAELPDSASAKPARR